MQSLSTQWLPPVATGDPSPSPASGRASGGASVSVLPTVASFFSSLSPAYSLQNKQHTSDSVPLTRENPADKSQSASEMINKVKLACNVLSCWVPSVKVVSDVVATLCSSLSVVQELGAALRDGGSTAGTVPAVAAFTLVALDNLGGVGAARPVPGQRGSAEKPIPVPDSKTLSMIGQDNYPADAFYRQTASFSHHGAGPGSSFKGFYDGGCHTISDLQSCLFGSIDRYAEVWNLRLSRVTIDGSLPAMGALACTMEPFSRAHDIRVENATIVNHRSGNYHQPVATGAVVGLQRNQAKLGDVGLHNCSVSTIGRRSMAGGVAGIANGLVYRTAVADSHVITYGTQSKTGLGTGYLNGRIYDLDLINSQVFTHGSNADAGGGAGMALGDVNRVRASGCLVSTTDHNAAGGIGAGFVLGNMKQISGSQCHVVTSGPHSPAGIGAGQIGFLSEEGLLRGLVAIDSGVRATGENSVAGVGAGSVNGGVERITSVRCEVIANDMAGVGAGINTGTIDGLTSVNSTARSLTESAGIGAGNSDGGVLHLVSWNSEVQGKPGNNTGTYEPRNLCRAAPNPDRYSDHVLIEPNCTATPSSLDELQRMCQRLYIFPNRGSTLRPIAVDSAKTLNRIGRDDNYPANVHYIQTNDIDGSKLTSEGSLIFSGHYDGQNYIIRNQTACLFKNLFGTVRNLRLVDARIDSDQPAAVVACEMDGVGGIESIFIERCRVATSGPRAPAGIICGRQKSDHNKVSQIDIHSSAASSDGNRATVGMVAGQCRGLSERVVIRNSQVSSRGERSHAGLGCGEIEGIFRHFSAACSQVETTAAQAQGGIVAGESFGSQLGPATIVNCNLTTSGQGANAGFAAGKAGLLGEVHNFTMLDSRVIARRANAGAGIGRMHFSNVGGMTVVRCEVLAEADRTCAGIGVGLSWGVRALSDITAVNCSLSAPGQDSSAYISGSDHHGRPVKAIGTRIANTRINGRLLNNTVDQGTSGTVCAGADPDFVSPACDVDQTVLPGGCSPPPLSTSAPPPLNTSAPSPLNTSAPPPLSIAAPAPLLAATGLSAGAAAGIAVSTVLVIGAALIGYCCYRRHYRQPADTPFQQFEDFGGEGWYDNESVSSDSI